MINLTNTSNQYNNQKYQKPGIATCVGGTIAGIFASSIVMPLKYKIEEFCIKEMKNLSSLNQDEFKQITNGTTKLMTSSGLANKGVSILRINNQNFESIVKMHRQTDKTELEAIKDGKQAGLYSSHSNKIIIPEKDMALSVFHEMGHAANANLSKLGYLLQKSEKIRILVIPIIITALLKTKKAPNEKPSNKMDKFTDFIKNNAGKLVFLTTVPELLEELVATIKGNNFAKKVLDPSLTKKVIKANNIGMLTYLSASIFAAIVTTLMLKVKDSIAKPKPIKTTQIQKLSINNSIFNTGQSNSKIKNMS